MKSSFVVDVVIDSNGMPEPEAVYWAVVYINGRKIRIHGPAYTLEKAHTLTAQVVLDLRNACLLCGTRQIEADHEIPHG